jgi:hypothetical protein
MAVVAPTARIRAKQRLSDAAAIGVGGAKARGTSQALRGFLDSRRA